MAFAPSAFAWDHGRGGGWGGGYGGGYHGGYYRGGGGYYRGGGHYDSAGRWIAGAIIAGAVVGLVANATAPRTVYYDQPVVYSRPATVVYEQPAPVVVERRVYETRTVVNDGYTTRYVRDDGYYGN
nr:hypothetical protein [Luteibacter sp. Sphag1AF]